MFGARKINPDGPAFSDTWEGYYRSTIHIAANIFRNGVFYKSVFPGWDGRLILTPTGLLLAGGIAAALAVGE